MRPRSCLFGIWRSRTTEGVGERARGTGPRATVPLGAQGTGPRPTVKRERGLRNPAAPQFTGERGVKISAT